jgi:hypothetical protein
MDTEVTATSDPAFSSTSINDGTAGGRPYWHQMAIPAQEIILPGDFEVSVALGADRTPTKLVALSLGSQVVFAVPDSPPKLNVAHHVSCKSGSSVTLGLGQL